MTIESDVLVADACRFGLTLAMLWQRIAASWSARLGEEPVFGSKTGSSPEMHRACGG